MGTKNQGLIKFLAWCAEHAPWGYLDPCSMQIYIYIYMYIYIYINK